MTSRSLWGAPPGYLKHVPGIRDLHPHPEPEGFALPPSSAPGASSESGLDLMLVPWGLLQVPLTEGGPTPAHPTCIERVSTVVTPNRERVPPAGLAALWSRLAPLRLRPGGHQSWGVALGQGGLAPPIFTGSSALTACGGPPGLPVGETESRGP